jgi:hypothetical protein
MKPPSLGLVSRLVAWGDGWMGIGGISNFFIDWLNVGGIKELTNKFSHIWTIYCQLAERRKKIFF